MDYTYYVNSLSNLPDFAMIIIGVVVVGCWLAMFLIKTEDDRIDYARMLHASGLMDTDGILRKRTSGVTYQLSRSDTELFFDEMHLDVRELILGKASIEHKCVLYIGREPSELVPAVNGPTFLVVHLESGEPILDVAEYFSESSETTESIAQKYDNPTIYVPTYF